MRNTFIGDPQSLFSPSGNAVSEQAIDDMLDQTSFLKTLVLERKRTDRSHHRFALMLLEAPELLAGGPQNDIAEVLTSSTRETDIKGWYRRGTTLGVIFTEIGDGTERSILTALSTKMRKALQERVGSEQMQAIGLSFHIYPEDSTRSDSASDSSSGRVLYPDISEFKAQKPFLGIKRAVDIIGSLFGILLSVPLFVAIGVFIKLTSKGPILFRQDRLGRQGEPFTFLKFRSMYSDNDPSVHKEYVRRLISRQVSIGDPAAGESAVYKLKADPRVTPIGKFLRRSSLDELPQLFNVLRGDMSLVGPRPPLSYEFAAYDTWHRRRLLAMKPGITGLWQITGRSRVTFDEMVRLDLKYARCWSLWLDFSILLRTPGVVLLGKGAY